MVTRLLVSLLGASGDSGPGRTTTRSLHTNSSSSSSSPCPRNSATVQPFISPPTPPVSQASGTHLPTMTDKSPLWRAANLLTHISVEGPKHMNPIYHIIQALLLQGHMHVQRPQPQTTRIDTQVLHSQTNLQVTHSDANTDTKIHSCTHHIVGKTKRYCILLLCA